MRLGPARTVLLVAATACLGGPPAPKPLNPVRFLSISDVADASTPADGGGVARVATVRNRIATEGKVLLVVAGDVLAGDTAAGGAGRRMIEALNAAKIDYATFGDDELRLDRDTLAARVGASSFKWVSGNCTFGGDTAFSRVVRWDTVRVSTHKVGIFALTMPGPYGSHVRCGDPDSAAHQLVDTLVAQGAELVVALTHQPTAADRDLLLRESRLDLILGGHDGKSHDLVISGRHLLKAEQDARTAQFVTLWGGKGEWRQAVGLIPIDVRVPPDTAVARVTNANPG